MTDSNEAIVALASAYHFAASRHVDQRRKGEAGEPYMNHLTEVAELVAMATDGSDVAVIVAAVLHDAVEDTDATPEEIAALFGDDVARLVAEVTDDKALPKAERKELQITHARHASDRAKLIKMADKISNLNSLAASPPAGWSTARIAEYRAWAARVVEGCRCASDILAAEFDRILALPVAQ